jgi:hypothetical protein
MKLSRIYNVSYVVLTAFIFDFAGLSVVWVLVELHGAGHIVVDSATKIEQECHCQANSENHNQL